MPTESLERKTINLPSSSEQAANRPFWLADDRAETALRELQEGELLQLVVNYSEEEIQFVNSSKQVAPDSVSEYFAAPSPHTFSFYRYPESGAVILIWTRHHWATSTKRTNAQRSLRRDLALIAEREGIKAVHMVTTFYHVPLGWFHESHKLQLRVCSQKDITGDCLREAISPSVTQGTTNLE
ncbi:hypothetical protein BKA56DRAFT_585983 [Ilyonectria sp. MPI-CAGE-AT-0026]|nr:hypothetical protein BKA56DRAFT_585983 [Ilyonectria sp. MPI-CAGE-AT-0026]